MSGANRLNRRCWSDWLPPSPKAAPQLVPTFGVRSFVPATSCRDIHPHGPIPPGSTLCCMACHASGVDALVRGHTKPGNGQIREGWQQPTPTVYAPADDARGPGGEAAPKRLKGGRR